MVTPLGEFERFRLEESIGTTLDVGVEPRQPPRHQRGEAFLRGPIPWNWLVKAMRLGRGPLALALVLWRLAGMKRSQSFRLPPSECRCVGERKTVYAALDKLEAGGLIEAKRHRGRGPTVTIRAVSSAPAPPESEPLTGEGGR